MQKILDLQKILHMIYQNFSLEKDLPKSKCTIILEKQLTAGPEASSLE